LELFILLQEMSLIESGVFVGRGVNWVSFVKGFLSLVIFSGVALSLLCLLRL
jgi:hypothetical protein